MDSWYYPKPIDQEETSFNLVQIRKEPRLQNKALGGKLLCHIIKKDHSTWFSQYTTGYSARNKKFTGFPKTLGSKLLATHVRILAFTENLPKTTGNPLSTVNTR